MCGGGLRGGGRRQRPLQGAHEHHSGTDIDDNDDDHDYNIDNEQALYDLSLGDKPPPRPKSPPIIDEDGFEVRENDNILIFFTQYIFLLTQYY